MSTLDLQAPAKLNLSLRVLGKRDDGFHEIDSLMVKLPGLSDILSFAESGAFSFTCDAADLPTNESNLVVKAVRAYEQAAGVTCRHSIHLAKRIPHGAGLGGGSSDAATTLRGLDHLHGDKLGPDRLREIAAALGSDVPFFLQPGTARCTSRGEVITPGPSLPALQLLLLKPWFGVPTPEAYGRWADSAELPGVLYAAQDLDGIVLQNDLERPVFAKHRFLAELKMWLLDRDEVAAALLCGSGSTIFAVLHVNTDATALAKAAKHELDPGLWSWSGGTGG